MALILTTTGISLLAYMDGVTVRSSTMSAVLIASGNPSLKSNQDKYSVRTENCPIDSNPI